jgi:hypothetical protein
MCNDNNFWPAVAAIATVAAVLVALFGQAFRDKFFPPKLALNVLSPAGELTMLTLSWVDNGVQQQRQEQARYYHVQVSNARRWSPAQQVQVMLLGMEESAADGTLQPVWSGELPLQWRHQALFPTARTIGADACIDICSVVKGKSLHLHPLVAPNNLKVVWREATEFVVTIQARGSEGDSPPLRLRISWDGAWDEGSLEMQRHLSIKPVNPREDI